MQVRGPARGAHLVLARARELRDAPVRDAGPLVRAQVDAAGRLAHEPVLELDHGVHVMQEPRIDARQLVRPLEREPEREASRDLEQPIRRGHRDRATDVLQVLRRIARGAGLAEVEPGAAGLERSDRLAEGLPERTADRHRLADALHLGAQRRGRARELLEREARPLHDHVIECGLERRGCDARDVVLQLVERVADRELRGDLRDREPRRLGGQRGAA